MVDLTDRTRGRARSGHLYCLCKSSQRGFKQGVWALHVWPTAALTTGLAHPHPHNPRTRSLPFQDLPIYAQPSTLWAVIYRFFPPPMGEDILQSILLRPCPLLVCWFIHYFLCLFSTLSLSQSVSVQIPFFHPLLSPSIFAKLIPLPFNYLSLLHTFCLY